MAAITFRHPNLAWNQDMRCVCPYELQCRRNPELHPKDGTTPLIGKLSENECEAFGVALNLWALLANI